MQLLLEIFIKQREEKFMNYFIFSFSCAGPADLSCTGPGARCASGQAAFLRDGSWRRLATRLPRQTAGVPRSVLRPGTAAVLDPQWKGLLGTRVRSAQE